VGLHGRGLLPRRSRRLIGAVIENQRALCDQATGNCWTWNSEELLFEAVFFEPDHRCINNLCEQN
jgi:hypothetical protein